MPQKKWNLGDIRAPERDNPMRRKPHIQEISPGKRRTQQHEAATPAERPRRASSRVSRSNRRFVVLSIVAVVLIGIFILSTILMRSAEIMVYPKFRDVTVNATVTAAIDPDPGMLGFELLTLDEVGERTVTATGATEVEERATGTITVYNRFSTAPQRLIKNTRFETPDGQIFRIDDSVDVPGYTTRDDARVPGSITVEVFADAPGEAYNIGPARFTIPGLAGTEQFEGMYAESHEPMRGGFVGTRLSVEDTDLARTRETIIDELGSRLRTRIEQERPAGFVLYDTAIRVRSETLPALDAGDGQATIQERVILEAPLFATEDLARYIARNTVPGYEEEPMRIDNPHALSFAYTEEQTDPARIEFALSGTARLVWHYDEHQLREDVAGASKTALQSIITKYPALQHIEARVKPFWKQSLPESVEQLRVTEVLR